MTLLEALEQSNSFTLMSKGSIKATQQMLSPSEEILYAIVTNVTKSPVHGQLDTTPSISDVISGVLTVTNRRVLFVNSVLGRGITKELRLSDIRSIDSKVGTAYECLRIAGISDMIVTSNERMMIAKLRNAINEALSQKDKPNTPPSNVSNDTLDTNDIEQLKTLKQLYDTGVITAEEFAAKKAQILNL